MSKQVALGHLQGCLPFGAHGPDGLRSLVIGGGDDTDEIAITDYRDVGHRFCRAGVERAQRGSERGGAEHAAVKQAGQRAVRRGITIRDDCGRGAGFRTGGFGGQLLWSSGSECVCSQVGERSGYQQRGLFFFSCNFGRQCSGKIIRLSGQKFYRPFH